jgi:hypothetical protein
MEGLEEDPVPFVVKDMKRAIRRHHRERLFLKYDDMLNKHRYWNGDRDLPHDRVNKLVDNFSICSCPMCRNPRRNPFNGGKDRLTIQERKAWNVDSLPLTYEDE